jgi:hypothetical protein
MAHKADLDGMEGVEFDLVETLQYPARGNCGDRNRIHLRPRTNLVVHRSKEIRRGFVRLAQELDVLSQLVSERLARGVGGYSILMVPETV